MYIKNYKQNLKTLYLILENIKIEVCATEFPRISKLRYKTKGEHYYVFSINGLCETSSSLIFL